MAIFLAIFDLCRFDGFLSLLSGCLVIVLVRRELCAGFFSLSTCFGGFGPRFSRVNVDLHNKTGALNDQSGPSKDNVTDEESMPIVSDVTLGNNKRKRDQGLSGDEEKSDGLAVPEVDDEMFWKYAPLSVVTAEYERRMGAERDPLDLISEGEESDHIILEMEERRGAGSVYDYFLSLNKGNLFVEDQNVQMVGSVDEVPSLKRPRQEDDCVDKYQTGALNDQSGPSKDNVTDEESMPIESDVTLGNNKRKRDQGLSGDEDKSDGLAVPEVDDEMFWKYAPLSVDLINQVDSDSLFGDFKGDPLDLISEGEESDHIIMKMEERRRAGSVYDYFPSLNKGNLFVEDQDVQMVGSVDEVPSLKRPRQEDDCVDKYQVEGEESDHIIMKMEERRRAGSVYDYFPSLNKGNLFVEDQDVQMVGSVDEVPSLKRPRQEDDCVDKYQVDGWERR
ncbi:hypothetical protein F2Q68_00043079 [Brassica cretica]|uniref:Protein TSSC4 n=1 Tax=Brassica cretica TaxID=69181 RepID=A0A8S9LU69_BRACR|nr:hypothetical protein F2Q68_00043079 [Brassica cretica]